MIRLSAILTAGLLWLSPAWSQSITPGGGGGGGSGSGTVTSVSVVSANGITGSVANPTTTPAITLTCAGGTCAPAASPTFTGTVTMPDAGTWAAGGINGSIIGGTTRAAGSFTTLAANSTANFTGTFQINSNTITWPAAAISVARIDAGQTFVGSQVYNNTSGLISLWQVTGATGNNSSIQATINSATNASQSLALFNDTSTGSVSTGINNSTAANTTLINVPHAGFFRTLGASNGGLYIGTSTNSANVVLFAGGNVTGTNNAITILGSNQRVQINQIGSDTGLTDTTVCQDTINHALFSGTGTAGICLGNVSSIRFKPDYALIADGLGVMRALDPGLYHYGPEVADGDHPLRVGFTAERYATVLPQFTRYGSDGRPNGTDMLAALPFAVRAIQQLDDRLSKIEQRAQ